MLYIKDNIIKDSNLITIETEDSIIYNPDHDALLSNGWEVYKEEPSTKIIENKGFVKTTSEEFELLDKSVYEDSIVFIENTKLIWSNNVYYDCESGLPSLDYEFSSFNSFTDTEKEEIINKLVEIRDTVTYVTLKFQGNKYYGKVSGSYPPIYFDGFNFNKTKLNFYIWDGHITYSQSLLTTTTDVQGLIDQNEILILSDTDLTMSTADAEHYTLPTTNDTFLWEGSFIFWDDGYHRSLIPHTIYKVTYDEGLLYNIWTPIRFLDKVIIASINTIAETTIPSSLRYIGQDVLDYSTMLEYVFNGGIESSNLVLKYVDTDTKNTAGATSSTSKLYLIGATEQTENPQTYTYSAYVDDQGYLCQGGSNTNKALNLMFRVLPFNITRDRFTPAGESSQSVYRPLQWNLAEGFTHHVIKYTSVYSPSSDVPEVIPISGPMTIIELRKHVPSTLTLRLLGEPVGAINNNKVSTTHVLNTTSSSSIFAPRKVIIFVDSYSSERLETINYQCLNNLTVNTIGYTAYDYRHGIPDESLDSNGTPMLNRTLGSYVLEIDLFLDTLTTPNRWNIFGTQKYTL